MTDQQLDMPFTIDKPSKGTRTSAEVLAQQRADAERSTATKAHNLPATTEAKPPAASDSYRARYASNDGWADAAAEAGSSAVRGSLVRFSDWRWSVGGQAVDDDLELAALSLRSAWVKWASGKPTEHVWQQPGRRLPDREELPDRDEAQWETDARGERRDPWRSTRYCYFTSPTTAASYTFSTASIGGRSALLDLADAIARMRQAHPHAVPIVRLDAVAMPTRYGQKSKPAFKIVRWVGLQQETIEPPTLAEEMNDEVPL